MTRNVLYLVIDLLAAGILVAAYLYYQESRSGISIEIGEQGVPIEGTSQSGSVPAMSVPGLSQ